MSQPTVIPDRVSFFGTSQGGGASLLLGSIYRDHGVRCVAADEPFLTNYPLSTFRGAYDHARLGVDMGDKSQAWHNLGFIDTLNHASRMNYPVLLTLGTKDASCPPECIQALYDELDTDKMLLSMKNRGHGYQYEFIRHALTWFELYA
jgi:cephalosporin-C deacetylase-like acetyl esterase